MSFDEATFACISKYLPGRIFNPLKPHRYGIKAFMTCCAVTGYCYKFEFYQGKSNYCSDFEANTNEKQSGPSALIRNMKEFKNTYRIVICDRFYTSVSSFIQLHKMGIFGVGTIIPNRVGYPKVTCIDKAKAKLIDKGTLFLAEAELDNAGSKIVATSWMDTKPVHLLSTGICNSWDYVSRRSKDGQAKKYNCCKTITTYHKFMGGVDQNDYMRMANYSIQSSYHARKWYKSIFLGLLDLALTNSYILWNMMHPNGTSNNYTRSEFLYKLVEGLLNYIPLDETTRKTRYSSSKKRKQPQFTDLHDTTNHKMRQFRVKKNKTTRASQKDEYDSDNKYIPFGSSGNPVQYQRCTICRYKRNARVNTRFYCNICQVACCDKNVIREDIDGERYICWNVLHENDNLIKKVERKNKRVSRSLNS